VYALFARLERYVFAALVALALWAAVLVAAPAAAQAQAAQAQAAQAQAAQAPEKATSNNADTLAATERHFVVVDPGDTLWSISAEVLRPNATPRQIAAGAERIHALNREQIGPDPNLIFAGQRLSVPPLGPEPPTSGRSAGTQPPARKADEAASGSDPAGRQAKHETLGAPSQAAAPKPAPLPDAAQAAPAAGAGPPAAEEPPRSPGESFVGEASAAVAGAASALAGLFPSAVGHEGHAWRELLGAALLAVSSVAFVLTLLLAFALAVAAPKRARRSQQGEWWREVRANGRAYEGAYEHASFDLSPDEELVNGTTGAHAHANGNANGNGAHAHANGNANGAHAHANGNVPVGDDPRRREEEGALPPSRPSGTRVRGR
jgi:hypothetical protein